MCNQCTYTLDKTWSPGVPSNQQPRYKTVKYCIYCPVLGYFNNWNIIIFSHRVTFSEDNDKLNQFVLDGISDNISALIKTVKRGAIIQHILP